MTEEDLQKRANSFGLTLRVTRYRSSDEDYFQFVADNGFPSSELEGMRQAVKWINLYERGYNSGKQSVEKELEVAKATANFLSDRDTGENPEIGDLYWMGREECLLRVTHAGSSRVTFKRICQHRQRVFTDEEIPKKRWPAFTVGLVLLCTQDGFVNKGEKLAK